MLGSAHLLSYYSVFGTDTLVTGHHKKQFIRETLITESKLKAVQFAISRSKGFSEWEIMASHGSCYARMEAGWPLGNVFPLSEEPFVAPQMLSWCPVQCKRLRESSKLGKWVYKGTPAPALEGLQPWQTLCFAKGIKVNFLTSNGRPKQEFLTSGIGIPDLQ